MAKKPKLRSRKIPPCGPVDIKAAWARIEVAIGKIAPDLVENLSDGADADEIAEFEQSIGQSLPDEVRKSFLMHNGQPGEFENPLISNAQFCSIEDSREGWDEWTNFDGEDPDLYMSEDTCCPEDAIQFAQIQGVSCMIEKFPLEKAQEAVDHMLSGKVRFRAVLTMSLPREEIRYDRQMGWPRGECSNF